VMNPDDRKNGFGRLLGQYPATLTTATVAIVILLLTLVGHVDLVRVNERLLQHIEGTSVDDVLAAVLLVVIGGLVDNARRARRERLHASLEDQRKRVFKATMVTVQDLVNNALMNLQLVRLEADAHLSASTLALFDRVIADTAKQLKALGDLEVIVERPVEIGMAIEFGDGGPKKESGV
jgi:hypothetical protein